jgi:hypothetical protein
VQVDFATRQLGTPIGIPLERHIVDSVLGAVRSEAKSAASQIEQIGSAQRSAAQLDDDQLALDRHSADRSSRLVGAPGVQRAGTQQDRANEQNRMSP